jgi:hypothetical protein
MLTDKNQCRYAMNYLRINTPESPQRVWLTKCGVIDVSGVESGLEATGAVARPGALRAAVAASGAGAPAGDRQQRQQRQGAQHG